MTPIKLGIGFEDSILVLTAYYSKTVGVNVCRFGGEEYIVSI